MSFSTTNTAKNTIHIPFLSEDEKVFLNTTATFSQVRRMSHSIEQQTSSSVRPSIEENNTHRQRRNQVVSVSSLALLWKRRDSSTSTCSSSTTATAGSVDQNSNMTSQFVEDDYCQHESSPKARELESLIFEQPQRTVRLSLTPGCAN
ncbi:hypothetical protein INT46_008317 [Mucor plumbeus]|uniref:Uncharacterized protein n=1 Tax=Mucor plumbeus TaxID=97098 RepID=A0A8H7UWT2_9FUNG|nr:hypothetical protein INT46_008317 [Mucor plumbeus]